LLLAASAARQVGDVTQSRRLLDATIARYPASSYGAVARLSRSLVALRQGHGDEVVRDLDAVVRTTGPWVIEARSSLETALAVPGSEGQLAIPTRPAGGVAGGDRLQPFAALLLGGRHRERSPDVLHGVVLLAAVDRGWSDVMTGALAARLLETFPSYVPASALLTRSAAAAASAGQWPIARRSYETLLARAPAAVTPGARLQLGEALYRTGATAEARAQLEQAAAPAGADAPRALLLLAEIHEKKGDRTAARAALQRLVHLSRGDTAAEGAYRIAEGLKAEGRHAAAVEWYLTAAYVGERTRWGRLSLLGAGRSLTALRETSQALAAYWKLVARRPGFDPTEDRESSGEAAYLAAEILRNGGLHEDALEMFATSAELTAGTAAERRALLGALQSFVALGDRASADATYRRLSSTPGADAETLAQARKALGTAAEPPRRDRDAGESALPKSAR
jgi:tetratricopeptide (TPR) repeat protein